MNCQISPVRYVHYLAVVSCLTSRLSVLPLPVPCSPTNVKASLRCHSNSAAVTWERASGAETYLAVGVTADGSHRSECNNTLTHCDLDDLRCGQTYNVSVFGQDESCSSAESNTSYVRTGTEKTFIIVIVKWVERFPVFTCLSCPPPPQPRVHPRTSPLIHSVTKTP